MQNQWSARLRLGVVLAGVICLIPAGISVSREKGLNHYQAQGDSSGSERPVSSKRVSTSNNGRTARRGGRATAHAIIFVGGKRTGKGNATKANPRNTKKVQGELNPQPIPPGKLGKSK